MDYECGALGILAPAKNAAKIVNFYTGTPVSSSHFHGNTKNTIQCSDIFIRSNTNICITVLDTTTWYPKWLYLTGRNVLTEHAACVGYRKVLLQYEDVSQIVWLSTTDLSRFCWDEQKQIELLAASSPTDQVSQPTQTY